eukprot:UN23965
MRKGCFTVSFSELHVANANQYKAFSLRSSSSSSSAWSGSSSPDSSSLSSSHPDFWQYSCLNLAAINTPQILLPFDGE